MNNSLFKDTQISSCYYSTKLAQSQYFRFYSCIIMLWVTFNKNVVTLHFTFSWTRTWAQSTATSLSHERGHELNRERENDGGVLLGGNRVQGLQVSKLDGRRGFRDHIGRLLQSPRRLLLTLSCDHLKYI